MRDPGIPRRIGAALAIGAVLLLLVSPGAPTPSTSSGEPSPAHAGLRPEAGPGPVAFVLLTITNTQATPTGTYQQLVTVNSSSYAPWIAANWSNVAFAYANSTPIPAWIEANASSSATLTPVWLRLFSIGASSSLTIYMDLYPIGTIEFSVSGPTGEAPQLTTPYGRWDNGASVFRVYGGRSWAGFTTSLGSWSTANGYLQQTAGTTASTNGPLAINTTSTFAVGSKFVEEAALSYSYQSVNAPRAGLVANCQIGSGATLNGCYRIILGRDTTHFAIAFLNDGVAWVTSGAYVTSKNTNYTLSVSDNAGTWYANLTSGLSIGGGLLVSMPAVTYTSASSQGLTTGATGVSAANDSGQILPLPSNFYWFRVRSNGVMPSTTFGALVAGSGPGRVPIWLNLSESPRGVLYLPESVTLGNGTTVALPFVAHVNAAGSCLWVTVATPVTAANPGYAVVYTGSTLGNNSGNTFSNASARTFVVCGGAGIWFNFAYVQVLPGLAGGFFGAFLFASVDPPVWILVGASIVVVVLLVHAYRRGEGRPGVR